MNILRKENDRLYLETHLPKSAITELGGKKQGNRYLFPLSAWVIKRLSEHITDLEIDESVVLPKMKPYDNSWDRGRLSDFQVDAVQ